MSDGDPQIDLDRMRDLRGRHAHTWIRRVTLALLAVPVVLALAGMIGHPRARRWREGSGGRRHCPRAAGAGLGMALEAGARGEVSPGLEPVVRSGMYLPDLQAAQPHPLSLPASAGLPSRPILMTTVASTMPTLLAILIVSASMSVDGSGVPIQGLQ